MVGRGVLGQRVAMFSIALLIAAGAFAVLSRAVSPPSAYGMISNCWDECEEGGGGGDEPGGDWGEPGDDSGVPDSGSGEDPCANVRDCLGGMDDPGSDDPCTVDPGSTGCWPEPNSGPSNPGGPGIDPNDPCEEGDYGVCWGPSPVPIPDPPLPDPIPDPVIVPPGPGNGGGAPEHCAWYFAAYEDAAKGTKAAEGQSSEAQVAAAAAEEAAYAALLTCLEDIPSSAPTTTARTDPGAHGNSAIAAVRQPAASRHAQRSAKHRRAGRHAAAKGGR